MKVGKITRSTTTPPQLEARNLFDDLFELAHCEGAHEVEVVDPRTKKTRTEYEYTFYLEAVHVENYDALVDHLVALKYTNGDEIALMRKGINDPENEEYLAYLEYVKTCKEFARQYKDALV